MKTKKVLVEIEIEQKFGGIVCVQIDGKEQKPDIEGQFIISDLGNGHLVELLDTEY